MQIRIAVLIQGPTSKLANKLAKKLSFFSDSYFWVDGKKLAYHITLFDILPTPKKLRAALGDLSNIVADQKSIPLSARGLWKSPIGAGYIGLQVKDNGIFRKFRAALFKGLKDYSPQEVGKKFNPHITLTRYKDFGFPDQVKNDLTVTANLKANKIIMAKVNKHGQVYKILKTFKLK